MRIKKTVTTLLVLIVLLTFSLLLRQKFISSPIHRPLLSFQSDNSRAIKWEGYNTNSLSMMVDTSIVIDGQHPMKYFPLKNEKLRNSFRSDSLTFFSFTNGLIIPPSHNEELEISLNCKTDNLPKCHFIVLGVNNNGAIVFTDTMDITNKTDWTSVKSKLPIGDVAFLRFEVKAYPQNFTTDFSLWLSEIQLTINGVELDCVLEQEKSDMYSINSEKFVSLSFTDETKFSQISALKTKKIVALGESIHGSQPVGKAVIDIMKYRILNSNCKLILLEVPFEAMLGYNRSVQGDDKFNIDSISGVLDRSLYTGKLLDFFRWVKDYNETASKKVWVFGLDTDLLDVSLYNMNLFHYLLTKNRTTLNDQDIINLANTTFSDFDMINTLKSLEEENKINLDSIELDMIKNYHELLPYGNPPNAIALRDTLMYQNISYLTDLICSASETVTLHSHLLHSCYDKTLTSMSNAPQSYGAYLKKKYGNEYFNIGLFVGEGEYTTFSSKSFEGFITKELELAYHNSLEYNMGLIGEKYFYTSVSSIPQKPFYMRAGGSNIDSFFIGYPNLLMDGAIYINESKSITVFRPDVPFEKKLEEEATKTQEYMKLISFQ